MYLLLTFDLKSMKLLHYLSKFLQKAK